MSSRATARPRRNLVLWSAVGVTALAAGWLALPTAASSRLRSALLGSAGASRGTARAVIEEPERIVAEGRLATYPSAEVTVGTEIRGRIVRLAVSEKSVVRVGDLLAELASADLRASLAEAGARIAEAEADIAYYEREVRRRSQLLDRGNASAWELDADRRALATARARRAVAAAQRDRFQAEVEKTLIRAPIGGIVTERHVEPGETVDAGDKILTIIDLARVRIVAEVDEYDAARVALGAEAAVTCEGFTEGTSWAGLVEEIPDTVTSRYLRPEDPGRPIDTRVLLVKIALAGPTPLKIGQRVEVRIARGKVEAKPALALARPAAAGSPAR